MKRFWYLSQLIFFLFPYSIHAADNVVNIYAWANEIPDFVVRLFEKETHIKVNISTYENNEIMYTKLRTTKKNAAYDIVMPSSYFVDRMRHHDMLEKLDKTKIPHWKNLNSQFLNPTYDPDSSYSVPFIWGVTGIFYNSNYFPNNSASAAVPTIPGFQERASSPRRSIPSMVATSFKPGMVGTAAEANNSIKKWNDLWDERFYNKLMLLDDTREIFSMGLLALGYSPNDSNPEHIKAAFLKLKELMQNVKVFSSDTVVSIIIDEDATVGMSWNGDAYKAFQDNKNIKFVFPEEGFVIWVDTFAIPKNAPHKEAAYAFINFMLRDDIGKEVALYTTFPSANAAAQKLLPAEISQNPIIYPTQDILKHGHFQTDLSDETLALFEKYWEELKMSG